MILEVRNLDIWMGQRNSFECCPVSKAIERVFSSRGRIKRVETGHIFALIYFYDGRIWRIKLTRSLLDFTRMFDSGVKVDPSIFVIEEKRIEDITGLSVEEIVKRNIWFLGFEEIPYPFVPPLCFDEEEMVRLGYSDPYEFKSS